MVIGLNSPESSIIKFLMSQLQLKICVVGPKGAGKSSISNFLSGQSSGVEESRYEATAGVRILEYEGVVSGGGWRIIDLFSLVVDGWVVNI